MSDKSKEEVKDGCIISVVGIVLIAPFSILRGFVISKLWAWFVTSSFGIPSIGIAASIGISLLVSYLTYQYSHTEDKRPFAEKMTSMLLLPLFVAGTVLLVGLIAKHYLPA